MVLIQAFDHWAQKLALSIFELSTLAFIFCSLNTFFFWQHKPLGITTATTLHCRTKMRDSIVAAGQHAPKRYLRTPIDFVKPPCKPHRSTLVCHRTRVQLSTSRETPTGQDIREPPDYSPRGIKIPDIIFAVVFKSTYFAIYVIGWNFYFSDEN